MSSHLGQRLGLTADMGWFDIVNTLKALKGIIVQSESVKIFDYQNWDAGSEITTWTPPKSYTSGTSSLTVTSDNEIDLTDISSILVTGYFYGFHRDGAEVYASFTFNIDSDNKFSKSAEAGIFPYGSRATSNFSGEIDVSTYAGKHRLTVVMSGSGNPDMRHITASLTGITLVL